MLLSNILGVRRMLSKVLGNAVHETVVGVGTISANKHVNPLEAINPDPLKVLLDLRLPTELQGKLNPAFHALGFTLEETTLVDPAGYGYRRLVHCFQANGGPPMYLVRIPTWLLQPPDEHNVVYVNFI